MGIRDASNMSDSNFSPFPDPGRRLLVVFRRAVWVRADPMYAEHNIALALSDLKAFNFFPFWFPFFAWDFGWWHGYVGWRPITLADKAFYWQELSCINARRGQLFVQIGLRMGVGSIS